MTLDVLDARRALHAGGVLREFNEAGVLSAADVHVAARLAALAGEEDDAVRLAVALAVRGPRLGHTRVDLAEIRATAAVDAEEEVDVAALPWPGDDWLDRLRRSPLVAVGEESDPGAPARPAPPLRRGDDRDPARPAPWLRRGDERDSARPLRLVGTALYLDRYWREERRVAEDLLALARPADDVDEALLSEGLARLFTGDAREERQRAAAATGVRRHLAVVAGGPGTGKTTTIARIVALLADQAAARGAPPPVVALATPTNTAAERLSDVLQRTAPELDVGRAQTLHRLLGRRPDSHSRFRHHRGNRLPHDVVIVDETSMVPLTRMARLVEAVRPAARLVLVGDPGQLASIEAGVVLGDVVGPMPEAPPDGAKLADSVVVLDHVYRHGKEIRAVAEAVQDGDGEGAIAALRAAPGVVDWVEADPAEDPAALAAIRERAVGAARRVGEAARAGRAEEAGEALRGFRLMCAHRRGPYGVSTWTERIESWLTEDAAAPDPDGAWYPGRPLLVGENDYALRLFNGETGVVVVTAEGDLAAAFEHKGKARLIRPGRLGAVDTAYAMTIHKSQGAQFHTAGVVLPDPSSRLLTRELLYTAVTRAQRELMVVGTEDALRAAIARPVARASGLRRRLWGE